MAFECKWMDHAQVMERLRIVLVEVVFSEDEFDHANESEPDDEIHISPAKKGALAG